MRWSWRRIPTIGAGFIVLIAGLAAYDLWRGYEASVTQTERELDLQARLIADRTARSVQAVDLVLRHVAERDRAGALASMDAPSLRRYLDGQSAGIVQLAGMSQTF